VTITVVKVSATIMIVNHDNNYDNESINYDIALHGGGAGSQG
jgi:hypothetical protein